MLSWKNRNMSILAKKENICNKYLVKVKKNYWYDFLDVSELKNLGSKILYQKK